MNFQREIVEKMEESLRRLLQKNEELRQENEMLRAEVEKQRQATQCAQREFEAMKEQYERLKVVRILSLSDDEKKSAYLRLSGLMREVKNCIKLISNSD